MINENTHKYSVSAMCKVLQMPRSTYYYHQNNQHKVNKGNNDEILADEIEDIFISNRRCYGTRKIKIALSKRGLYVSRRKIGVLMKQRNLVSTYTKMKFKVTSSKVNQSTTKNHLNRNFKKHKQYKYIVSDLTYVRVDNRWHYVCLFSDLYNREIIGYSVGQRKNADLVFKALASIETNLFNISYIHTDRGREFDNQLIDKVIDVFNINRSLSRKGNPYDNAVAETIFKAVKTEFINTTRFYTIEQLEIELKMYINWYNNERIHAGLNYQTPTSYKLMNSV